MFYYFSLLFYGGHICDQLSYHPACTLACFTAQMKADLHQPFLFDQTFDLFNNWSSAFYGITLKYVFTITKLLRFCYFVTVVRTLLFPAVFLSLYCRPVSVHAGAQLWLLVWVFILIFSVPFNWKEVVRGAQDFHLTLVM